MSNPNTHIVADKVFLLQRKSKWTWEAVIGANKEQVATAPSRPKLKTKLDEMFNHSVLEPSDINRVNNCPSSMSEVKTSKPKAKTDKKPSMRKVTLDMILDGKTDDEILQYINENYSDVKYNRSHVQWYRSNFAKSELIGPEFAPVRSKAHIEWLKNNNK